MTEHFDNFRWGFIRDGKELIGSMPPNSKRTMECDEVERRADKWRAFFSGSIITIERVIIDAFGWHRVDQPRKPSPQKEIRMTKFAIVDPKQKLIRYVEYKHIHEAYADAGLAPGAVDHGTVTKGLGIVVYEYSLNQIGQDYFSFDHQLYGGPAVLYGVDDFGETVDLEGVNEPRWLGGDVEKIQGEIEAGEIQRPIISVNDIVLWKWPAPLPKHFGGEA